MVLVDLRNHGRSVEIEGLEPPHDITNATNDLANLVKAEGWAWLDVVIGHSMGGKVALHFIRIYAHAIYSQSATSPKQVSSGMGSSNMSFLTHILIITNGEIDQ